MIPISDYSSNLLEKLLHLTNIDLQGTSEADKHKIIFNTFVKYITDSKWIYEESSTHTFNLLSLPSNQAYRVHCAALANALKDLFVAHNLNDVVVESFNLPGHTLKFRVNKVSMRCFDIKKDEEMKSKGYADFSKHFVVKRTNDDLCFDPTFCCTYNLAEAPTDFRSIGQTEADFEQELKRGTRTFDDVSFDMGNIDWNNLKN